MAPPMTLASQTPGISLTHVVRMGADPAAAPKSPSRAGPNPPPACLWDCALGFFLAREAHPSPLPLTTTFGKRTVEL